MPIYDYECSECGATFEAFVRGPESPVCPECQSTHLEQMISMFAVSSESTRAANLKTAREKNKKVQRDKVIAEQEAADHHD